jgi:cytochrome c551/c552
MQGPNDEASVPNTYVIDKRMVGVTMRRKIGIRTYPWPAEDLPAAKRPRLQAQTSFATAVDEVTTDPPDDTPTVLVTPAASLPSAASSSATRRSWNGEEDAKLTEAVKKHGKHWVAVAVMVPGRTRVQCRKRWVQTVDPDNGKIVGKWKGEEDAKLTEAVTKYGNNWVAVAAMVPGRTNVQCRERWTNTVDPANSGQGKWTPEEDVKLAEAVKKHGKHWVLVAAMVPGRTNRRCRHRWVNSLDPAVGKSAGKWKGEEDAKLTEAVKKHGKEWVAIAALVHGRTSVQCCGRWTNILDPAVGTKAGKWKGEEDAKLTEAVKQHSTDWVAVAAMVPGRTNQQCRIRWVKSLDQDRASNTVEEDPDLR